MNIELLIADYTNNQQASDISFLLDNYAQDPMGGGAALPVDVKQCLAQQLARVPNAFTVLGYVDGKPAALANCFQGFSTFRCMPLINIHDLAVESEYRGLGLSQMLLAKVQQQALERGCCKITLEVLEGNDIAQKSYKKSGFKGYQLDAKTGMALFWQKEISAKIAEA